MRFIPHPLRTTLLIATLAMPLVTLAEVAPAQEAPIEQIDPVASPAERRELMQTIHARMKDIMQTQDPAKRQALLEEQARDMETMMKSGGPGMGMGGGMGMMKGAGGKPDCKMGQGPGMGPMMGPDGGKPDCMMGQGPGMGRMMSPDGKKHCKTGQGGQGSPCDRRGDDNTEERLDSLEKRMDMMQMMMRMMLRD